MARKIVHVVGTGTIGEPLIGLLCDFKDDLGIDEVTFHKNSPLKSDLAKVNNLLKRGARLTTHQEKFIGFNELDLKPEFNTEDAIDRASVVIDCTPTGYGHQNKNDYYEKYASNTLGFVAQGSEFGFGKMYARGINDNTLIHGEDQFIHVVSCNTHNLSVITDTIALADGPDNLINGRFNLIRRANDVSQAKNFIPSPQVGSHKDPVYGTHHARDAAKLFETLDLNLDLFSSAMKINTQYMHILYFHLTVKNNITLDEVISRLASNDRIAITEKNNSNEVFSFGRDYGHYGRILNQAVVAKSSLSVRNGNEIMGYCFTPQDGNSLLSSLAITEWFLYPNSYEDKIQCLKPLFFDEV
jgi:glyceraldehyde-3-phosphate dehydrogenase (NAD(P))